MTVLALMGAKALYFLFIWLASCIVASYLSNRKGYGEKLGLGTGMLLSLIGAVIWLIIPPKAQSDWKRFGPFGTTRKA